MCATFLASSCRSLSPRRPRIIVDPKPIRADDGGRSTAMNKRFALVSLAALMLPACTHRPAPLAPQAADKLPVICRLVSRDQTITISAGPHGSVYSVQDARGQMLLSYASREELRARHPELSQQLDSAIVSTDALDNSKPIDVPAGSFDRVQGSFFNQPLMLKAE